MTTRRAVRVSDDGPWPAGLAIIRLLHQAGYEAYAVGGCVRDLILQRQVADVDVATVADPDTVESVMSAAGLRTVAVGKSFGVMVVISPSGENIEVATFRTDGEYVDGRRPTSVRYADAISDVERRDFTINALLLDCDAGEVVDHIDGLRDIDAHCLRTVGDPQRRFAEDRLRVLRALRFAAVLDFVIDAATWQAMTQITLGELARERILAEWTKAMSGPGRGRWLRLSHDCGCLAQWCPPSAELTAVDLAHLVRVLEALPPAADPLVAQASLLAACPDQAATDAWLEAQPLATHDRHALTWLAGLVHEPSWHNEPVRRYRTLQAGPAELVPVLLRAWTPQATWMSDLTSWCADTRAQPTWKPVLSAKDLLAMGWSPGPKLGQVLRELGDAELAGQVLGAEAAKRWLDARR
jgi:poly(A) polymerase